jgi:D-alanine-D-alanine ligase-like ATP-grasp enzyme
MTELQATARTLAALCAVHKAGRHLRRRSPGARELETQRTAFYRSIWQNATRAAGAEFVELGGALVEIRLAATRMRVRNHVTSLDDPVTLNVAGDKHLVHRLLEHEGIPTPKHILCGATDLATAWRFANELRQPSVVKPARGTAGGSGITTGVASRLQLASAMAAAGALCPDILLEEQVEGENYRLLYFDGELLDAVLRSSPAVRGNGRATVRELIARENRRRIEQGISGSQRLVRADASLRHTLEEQGMSLRAVPREGELVRLKRDVSENRAEDNESAAERLSASIVADGARAADAVGVRLAGVDIICPDPRVPLEQSGGVVLEVNTTPSLYYHYVKKPGPTDVALMILTRFATQGQVS